MTEKELRKLKRSELLQILLEQQKEIERLEKELENSKNQLDNQEIIISKAGSIAQASFALSDIFEEAQRVADIYVRNVKRQANRTFGTPIYNTEKSVK